MNKLIGPLIVFISGILSGIIFDHTMIPHDDWSRHRTKPLYWTCLDTDGKIIDQGAYFTDDLAVLLQHHPGMFIAPGYEQTKDGNIIIHLIKDPWLKK